jgi:hypothetical protein
VRRRVQAAVDRRDNRARYDVQRAVEQFGEQLRRQVALEEVCAELVDVVGVTLQPASASLWLRRVGQETSAGPTTAEGGSR